jgi:protein-S-isoprenylcysteine O-methyltransferase Ste14
MRWTIFVLLLLGILFGVSTFVPAAAGHAGLLWPFAADTKPIVASLHESPRQSGNVITPFLAGIACLFYLAAVVGLFWEAVPTQWWPALVVVAASTSLLLYILYCGVWMLAPILVDVALLWGVLTNRWTAKVLPRRALPGDPAGIHPLMNIPVPWVFITAFLAGVGLQYLMPATVHAAVILQISHIIGIVLLGAGAVLALTCLGIFRTAHTTTVPFETVAQLVTWGPYRVTRNPMYVSLTLMYLGEGLLLAELWPLLLLPLPVLYVQRIVIPFEEGQLREVFGDEYEQYCARVHRWI